MAAIMIYIDSSPSPLKEASCEDLQKLVHLHKDIIIQV